MIKSDQNLITHEKYKEIQQLKEKSSRILSIISRDHMKVVFFGRLVDRILLVQIKKCLFFVGQAMGKVQ